MEFVRCDEEVDYVPVVHEVLQEYDVWTKENFGTYLLRFFVMEDPRDRAHWLVGDEKGLNPRPY